MLDLYCWKHGPDGADRAAPQLRAGQHVGFVHRAEPARAAFGPREAKRRDAFNLRGGVGFGVEGALDTSLHLVPALTEVHSPGQFANDFNGQMPRRGSMTFTGRRFTYSPRPFRKSNRPLSGRLPTGSESHFGPPTAPRKMASALRQASRASLGRGLPVLSIPEPPTGSSTRSN